ncbi:MAG: hypothetical protein KDC46_12785 [Thermoleophilia bacterium]|nr:hypothetical protein [Thermoleophilia bacterium]
MTVQATAQAASSWASSYVASVRARIDAGLPAFDVVKPDQGPQVAAPPATDGTGHDRDWLDGVTPDRPTAAISTILTNVTESITGHRDERLGRAEQQVLLAGYQFAQAGLNYAARGTGIIATGSSVLGKILPLAGIAGGIGQIWQGWNELQSHDDGLLSVFGSRTARSGIVNVIASALSFVPGFGTAIGAAVTRLVGAANEMDAFSFLDKPTQSVESKGEAVARKVHVLDETPTVRYDHTDRNGNPVVDDA